MNDDNVAPYAMSTRGGGSGQDTGSFTRRLSERALSRRDFAKAALAIGGTGALGACLEREGRPDVPVGASDPESAYPRRVFAWNEWMARDGHGNTSLPNHQLILFLDYADEGVPTAAEREQVEATLGSVEQACQRGNGGVNPYRPGGETNAGLLWTIGYGPRYFERFDADLPPSVDLPRPEETLEAVDEDPEKADPYEAALLFSSDHAHLLLEVEQAIWGNLNELNGYRMRASLEGVLELAERRTGFVGQGLPRKRLDVEEIPPQAPMSMGFTSGFADNQATEDRVALEEGPFAEGSLQHISRLEIDAEAWWSDNDDAERIELMFTPEHTPEDIVNAAERLATDSEVGEADVERLEDDAENHGIVGHTQKVARARDENFDPKILRRSEAISTGAKRPGFNFTSLQRDIEHFVEVREAMNSTDIDLPEEDHGILEYLEVEHRGNYLVPPRELRALPPADPEVA